MPDAGVLPETNRDARPQAEPQREDDAPLMARIAEGDRHAYSLFVDTHMGAILNYARRYTRNHADAQDVTQETFLRLWRKARDWRDNEQSSARAWLYRIAYNLCVDLYRRKSLAAITPGDGWREENWEADESTRPEIALQRDERLRAVDTALRQLPERQYSAIALCTYQGLSNIEAAEVLGVGVDALESLLARGRRRLRELLLENRD